MRIKGFWCTWMEWRENPQRIWKVNRRIYFLCDTLARIVYLDCSFAEELGSCILLGRESLVAAQKNTFNFLTFVPCCLRCQHFVDRRTAVGLEMVQEALMAIVHTDDEGSLCSECIKSFNNTRQSARQEVWDKLPGYFGLGTWNEIRKRQRYGELWAKYTHAQLRCICIPAFCTSAKLNKFLAAFEIDLY